MQIDYTRLSTTTFAFKPGTDSMGTNLKIDRCNSSMQLTRAADYAVRVMII